MTSGAEAVVAVDTSAISQLWRGHAGIIDVLARPARLIVPAIVIGELEAGFHRGARRATNLTELDRFLARANVAVASVDRAVASRYGGVFDALRRAGTPIGSNDIWIAAICFVADARLATFDRDFEKVAGLDVLVLE
jgi:tRNA(fMet)-specific endonuclease VapC